MRCLSTELRGITRLGLDTSPIIYFVEANPTYDALVTEVFSESETTTSPASPRSLR